MASSIFFRRPCTNVTKISTKFSVKDLYMIMQGPFRGERRKKMQVCEKVGKSRFTVVCPMICGSRGSKSRLAEAAGAEPAGQMRDEKLQAIVARTKHICQ